jgi:predicted transcriptional regulator
MKNVTLSADNALIERARRLAKAQSKTLNQAFREWLADYTRRENDAKAIDALYKGLSHVNSGGRKFTREEMNER